MNAQDAQIELLKTLGHYDSAAVRKANGTGYYAVCECGYQSTTRRTLRDVIQTVEHHRRKAIAEFRTSGLPVELFANSRR